MSGGGGTDDGRGQWALVCRVGNRPGVMARTAAQFSTRGINVDVVSAAGAPAGVDVPTRVLVVFRATERRAREMARIVVRLADVDAADLVPSSDAALLGMARARLGADATAPDAPDGVTVTALPDGVVAVGPWAAVDAYVTTLVDGGATDVTRAALA